MAQDATLAISLPTPEGCSYLLRNPQPRRQLSQIRLLGRGTNAPCCASKLLVEEERLLILPIGCLQELGGPRAPHADYVQVRCLRHFLAHSPLESALLVRINEDPMSLFSCPGHPRGIRTLAGNVPFAVGLTGYDGAISLIRDAVHRAIQKSFRVVTKVQSLPGPGEVLALVRKLKLFV